MKKAYKVRGFDYIDTGFNDKYAYGYDLAKVELSRGKAEGNNAFTYDQKFSNLRKTEVYYQFKLLFTILHMTDLDTIEALHMKHKHRIFDKIKTKF